MQMQLSREKEDIKKKLKKAMDENTKMKIEHRKLERNALKQNQQMDQIMKQLESVQQENTRLAMSVSKLESSFVGVSSTRSSYRNAANTAL